MVLAKNQGLIPLLKPYFDRIQQQTNFHISTFYLPVCSGMPVSDHPLFKDRFRAFPARKR